MCCLVHHHSVHQRQAISAMSSHLIYICILLYTAKTMTLCLGCFPQKPEADAGDVQNEMINHGAWPREKEGWEQTTEQEEYSEV